MEAQAFDAVVDYFMMALRDDGSRIVRNPREIKFERVAFDGKVIVHRFPAGSLAARAALHAQRRHALRNGVEALKGRFNGRSLAGKG